MTKLTPALISGILFTFSPLHLIAQDEACLGISSDTINWLSFNSGEGPGGSIGTFQSDPADLAFIDIELVGGETAFREGYPRGVTDGT